jgi:hypothetical protein
VRPTNPDEAFLAVSFDTAQLPGRNGVNFGNFAPLPGSAVQLSSGGKTMIATTIPQTALGLLSPTYVFAVPVASPGGRITVTPGTQEGMEFATTSAAGSYAEVRFSSPNTTPPPGSVTTSTTPQTTKPKTRQRRSPHTGGSVVLPAALASGGVGGVTLLFFLIVIPIRRRRVAERIVIIFPSAQPLRPEGEQPAPGSDDRGAPEPPAGTPAVVPRPKPRLMVKVLGPVQVEGLGAVPRRHAVAELCCYLALNGGREISSDELRTALGTGEGTLAPSGLYNLVAELRKALGDDVLVSDGHAGYRFAGDVTCDWLSFQQLVRSPRQTDAERIADLQEAISLVRGYPFQAAPKGRYEWASESNGLSSRMAAAIENAVVELAGMLLEADRDTEAYDAAQAGISAVPYSYAVNTCLLQAARKDRGRLERTWREVSDRLGDVPELRELKDALVADWS